MPEYIFVTPLPIYISLRLVQLENAFFATDVTPSPIITFLMSLLLFSQGILLSIAPVPVISRTPSSLKVHVKSVPQTPSCCALAVKNEKLTNNTSIAMLTIFFIL